MPDTPLHPAKSVPPTVLGFRKMHGLGNDFVVIDARNAPVALSRPVLERIADRRFGVGCDQLIVLEPSLSADARMRIYNPDGGEVEACGNATRCVGHLLAHEKRANVASIETLAGILIASRAGDEIQVDMGEPALDWASIPLAGTGADTARVPIDVAGIDTGLPAWFSAVSMGNPHAVFFVDEVNSFDLPRIGPMLETHPLFVQKANISLVQVVSRQQLRQRVWERAAGITLACGTAACASAVAAWRLGLCEGEIRTTLPGGDLRLGMRDGHVLMTGPVATSFTGVIDPSLLKGLPA